MKRRDMAGVIAGWLLAVGAATAADLTVTVLDRSGKPVSDVVVTVAPSDGRSLAPLHGPEQAVMAQNHRAFIPTVLVVGARTSVAFPNNDTVSHQVYSFSPAKQFQLPLYKGRPKSPIAFEREGLVVLGCNIHDEMVGYIFVTEAPRFGKTDAAGRLELKSLPAGEYQLVAWSPFIADDAASLKRRLHVEARGDLSEQLTLAKPLRSRPSPNPSRNKWDY